MQDDSSKKLRTGLLIAAGVSLIFLILSVIFLFRKPAPGSKSKPDQKPKSKPDLEPDQVTPVSFCHLVENVLECDQDTAKILTAQAMLESGVFTSQNFIEQNNPFGMHLPVKRDTNAVGSDDNNFAIFDSLEESIQDLALWFEYHEIPIEFKSTGSYAAKIREYEYYSASYASYAGQMKLHFARLTRLLKDEKDN